MFGAGDLALLSGVAVVLMGLALPMWGFTRLSVMRALERRRQSATAPTVCLTTLCLVLLLDIVYGGGVPMLTIYGVVVNALWLWVVKTRGRQPIPRA